MDIKKIKKELEKVYDDDQNIRVNWDIVLKRYGKDSIEFRNYLLEVDNIQKRNLLVVENIISKYGWLSSKIIGSKANTALFLVIQHADNNIMEKYNVIIQEAFKKGNIDNNSYAMFQDRLLLNKGKKQIYGTQFIFDESKKRYVLDSSISIEEINKQRNNIGLNSIEERESN